ncbi:MAG: glycosyltransferase family 39 protein [Candidatus Micrarchaeota archaeon]|nr:glycosyltransferase family 39 protein [Candidatus Micrarchaeota archaeon]
MKLPINIKNTKQMIFLLLIVYTITRLFIVSYVPLVKDETIYAMMIEEQAEKPTLITTFLGYDVGWKPPVFFWIYASFIKILKVLPLPLEHIYRLPTVFFGAVNVVLVYFFIKKLHTPEIAFLTALIYECLFLTIYTDNSVLTDTLNMTFVFISLLFYINKKPTMKNFIIGATFAFLAFYVKFALAFIVPVLVISYYFFNDEKFDKKIFQNCKLSNLQYDKKILKNPILWYSFIAILLAPVIYYSLFSDKSLTENVYNKDILDRFLSILEPIKNIDIAKSSLIGLFFLVSVFLVIGIAGLKNNWKKYLFFASWLSLIAFPIFSGNYLPWHFLPIALPLAFFSAIELSYYKEKYLFDRFSAFILILIIIVNLALGMMFYDDLKNGIMPEKSAGEFLAFKQNVAIIGDYPPTIIAYKTLKEKRKLGHILDYGWILGSGQQDNESYQKLGQKYFENINNIENGSFAKMFYVDNKIFRKDTNISKFDYLVAIGWKSKNGKLIWNSTNINIYDISSGINKSVVSSQ